MAFITAPALGIRTIEWALDQPAQINASTLTGKRTPVAEPWFGKWRAVVELAPIVGVDQARILRSFFARCLGMINTFRLLACEGPQNANSGVTVSGTAAAGASSLTISGAATAMKVGQHVTVNDQLLILTAVAGNVLTFVPRLRAQATGGTAIETANPYALVHLSAPTAEWSIEPGTVSTFKFEAMEAY